MDVSLWGTFNGNRTTREGAAHRVLIEPRSTIHARHFTSSIGRLSRALQMESYPTFHNEVGCRSCALAAASSSASGINRRKITHTSTSRWVMPVRSSAPIALHYSASIRAWAHTKLIRQIVLTVIRTKLKSSNAASFVMPAAANQRQAPSSRSFGAVHDGHE